MDNENNLYLINNQISVNYVPHNLPPKHTLSVPFDNYNQIELLLKNLKNTTVHLYDYTTTQNATNQTFYVNDHINRIGDNPFIGHQKQFNIDFINTENIYTQHPKGIITDSCGAHPPVGKYPSSYLANIAVMAHIFQCEVKGFLIKLQ